MPHEPHNPRRALSPPDKLLTHIGIIPCGNVNDLDAGHRINSFAAKRVKPGKVGGRKRLSRRFLRASEAAFATHLKAAPSMDGRYHYAMTGEISSP